ncbi:MAG TPA: alcohol dehydrogenase catalytic domain-containing protein, partial [Xanthomonadaceae bacterium]|nr:alcohol dehydrogenase catalytic domain-containing protein [Xanthomonadaceae bacterium]
MTAAAPASMRAAVLNGARDFRIERRAMPPLQRGHVRIAVEGCGVCASSLPLWSGRPWFSYPQPPGTPGHEGWGAIVDAADDVEGWRVGERVVFLSDRAFAEQDVTCADAIARIPACAGDRPLPGEPLACSMNVLRRADIQAGMDVAVVGVGFIGALLVQLATSAGARVVAFSRRAWAREVARGCGATETFG